MNSATAAVVQDEMNTNDIPSARRQDRRRMLFWLAPPILWFTVFMLVPYAMLFYYSLGSVNYVTFEPGFSAANFIKVFTTQPYLGVMLKSAKLGLMTAIFTSILAYPVAFCLAFYAPAGRAKNFLYMLVIVPWWASYLVKAYAWKTILGSHGLINQLLLNTGIISHPLTFLLYNEFSVALTLTYIFTPFAILSIYSQLERIPVSLIEGARDLGATGWQIFYKIVFPISVPGILAGAVITFSLAFGDFISPALVGGPNSIMISNIVINLLGRAFDWPLAAAIGLVIIGMATALITVANHIERRLTVRL